MALNEMGWLVMTMVGSDCLWTAGDGLGWLMMGMTVCYGLLINLEFFYGHS